MDDKAEAEPKIALPYQLFQVNRNIRGFPKTDHSDMDAKILLEKN